MKISHPTVLKLWMHTCLLKKPTDRPAVKSGGVIPTKQVFKYYGLSAACCVGTVLFYCVTVLLASVTEGCSVLHLQYSSGNNVLIFMASDGQVVNAKSLRGWMQTFRYPRQTSSLLCDMASFVLSVCCRIISRWWLESRRRKGRVSCCVLICLSSQFDSVFVRVPVRLCVPVSG